MFHLKITPMSTLTQNKTKISEARKARFPIILDLLQHLRTNKSLQDDTLHPLLTKAWSEAAQYGLEAKTMLLRALLHIGDVSRHHNMLKKLGIQSTKGGAGERENFRSILRWLEKNQTNTFYANLNVFAEFTVLENLIYDQIRTDRKKGTVLKQEKMSFDKKTIASYFAEQIIKSKNPLIAKHLPKYATGKYRYSNGKKRPKQTITLEREKRQREFIRELCSLLNWTIEDYKEYRKRQSTPEQLFSSHKINNLSEDLLMKMFDRMTSSQRFRIAHMVTNKDGLGHLQPTQKWERIGLAYIKWENRQTRISDEIRNTDDVEKKELLQKEFKVKATGMQTIDLLVKLFEGADTEDQINNTYQALIDKMDLIGNVFTVIDGSASMRSSVTKGWNVQEKIDSKYSHLSLFEVAAAMAIAFSTRNPNPDYRNQFGWFSNDFVIVGESQYRDTSPNPYVKDTKYIVRSDGTPVISDKYPFIKNLRRIAQENPGIVGSTNIGKTIEYFVNLHRRSGMDVEQLPKALLFITDNEGNRGMPPDEFMAHAAQIGWFPLVIFWGIQQNHMSQYKNIPNCLFIGGFNESVLSQILRGIKSGSIVPETELWSINDDPRYSVINI
jgi:hypothetical protein